MGTLGSGLLALSLVLLAGRPGLAGCTDQTAVNDARAAADLACDQMGEGCTTAASHGVYVACVAEQARAAAEAQRLPRECRGAVVRCAARSTCEKSGFVSCCRTNATGATRCSTKSSAARCTALPGGAACVGNFASCCDACTATGCASTTSTTTVPDCTNVNPSFGTCSSGGCPTGQSCVVWFFGPSLNASCRCAADPVCGGSDGVCSGNCPFGVACVDQFGGCHCVDQQ